MALLRDMGRPEQQIAMLLGLIPGDIIFSEMPFDDANHEDFTHFNNLSPGHTCVWVSEQSENAFARAHQEGYRPPGLTLTGLWPGRHAVYRYTVDASVAKNFADIMRNWASYTLNNQGEMVPSTNREQQVFLSAANDLFALFKNQNLVNLGSEGVRRAIKFAAHRGVVGEPERRKGQRCTAVVAAAFQASILACIVKHTDNSAVFKPEKGSLFLEYADLILESGWREHPLGKRLLLAASTNDYSMIFPLPFNVDQRYATPKLLYEKLQQTDEFCLIGHYSYFNQKLIAVEKNEAKRPNAKP